MRNMNLIIGSMKTSIGIDYDRCIIEPSLGRSFEDRDNDNYRIITGRPGKSLR